MFQCHIVHHKSHVDRLSIELGYPQRDADDKQHESSGSLFCVHAIKRKAFQCQIRDHKADSLLRRVGQ
jgi:hypothetical protein